MLVRNELYWMFDRVLLRCDRCRRAPFCGGCASPRHCMISARGSVRTVTRNHLSERA